ncbi:MAG TPA: PP2C family protein-serine/threonine phosphatase [Terriglobia bacterium]|nr:PP2C family protein-serine/threonine phosphatase [Terriglobia bacterium]
MASETKRFFLFKALIALGFALSIVLLFGTISTYKYVSGELLLQEAERDTQRKVNTLVGAVRTAQTQDMEIIGGILEEFLQDWNQQVAWIRILDGMGRPLAKAGLAPTEPVLPEDLPRPFSGDELLPEREETPHGPVLVSIRSFRTVPLGPGQNRGGQGGFGGGPPRGSNQAEIVPPAPAPPPPPAPPGEGGQGGRGGPGSGQTVGPGFVPGSNEPGFGARGGFQGGRGGRPPLGMNWNVEVALIPDSVSGSFASLQRNLFVGVSASLALMAALILIAVRFPYYLRGQQIERELDLARRVQADLLPSPESISPYVDFSTECISAWQVGGDFCDVFHVSEDRTALVLGDVSGKGISAALLMALIHGAIHSVSWTRSTQDHVNASRQLNTLLCQKTATERFTSLFWGCFDPQRSTIQYINAGHLPPYLVRKTNGNFVVHRLETGGPVMGLLPGANFQQGEEFVASGDLLVAFSDGVVEAMSPSGEEFGDKRLLLAIQERWEASANEIRSAIHTRLKEFTGSSPVLDDQTLIVVRFKHSPETLAESRSIPSSVVQVGGAPRQESGQDT